MFTKALFGDTKGILAVLGNSNLLKDAYLAGGTAVALQLGHRLSFDLDFFTPKEFNTTEIINQLQRKVDFRLEDRSAGTILDVCIVFVQANGICCRKIIIRFRAING